jgi:hypothetical protein
MSGSPAVTSSQHASAFFLGGGTQLTEVTSSATKSLSEGRSDGLDGDRTHVDAGERQDPEKWDKLSRDDLELIAGRRDRLETKIRHLYGFSPDHVRKELMIGSVGRCSSAHAVGASWADRGRH